MSNPNAGISPRHLSLPGQLLAWSMIVFPILGMLLTQLVPGPEGALRRVRLLGLAADNMALPLLGLFLGVFLAELFRQRRLRWFYTVLCLVVGLVLLLGTPVLFLDALQVRGTVRPEMQRLYTLNAIRSLLLLLTAAMILLITSIAIWRALRRERVPEPIDRSPPSGLVRPGSGTSRP